MKGKITDITVGNTEILIRNLRKQSEKDSDQILKMNDRRFISQTTKIICAMCGEDFKISNRHKLPFKFELLNNKIGKIWMPCPKCGEEYDLGICIYY